MKKVNMKVAIDIKKGRSSTKIVGGEGGGVAGY